MSTALVAVVSVFLGAPGSTAAPQRAPSLRGERVTLSRLERRAVLDLYVLESRLGRARATLAAVQARASELAVEQRRLRRRAVVVRHSAAVARVRLERTIRSLYRVGNPDPVAILLGAASIDEAFSGIDDLRRVARANAQLVVQLRAGERRVRVLDARLLAHRRRLDDARRRAEAAVAGLERATRARARMLAVTRAQLDLTTRRLARIDRIARAAERRSAELTASRPAPAAAAEASRPVPAHAAGPPGAPPAPGTSRTLVVAAVAYHLPGRTASGLPVGVGVVAVDPAVIPLGTRMFVPGYGAAVAADVGSAVRGNVIDLWMPSRSRALDWGRRSVTITLYG